MNKEEIKKVLKQTEEILREEQDVKRVIDLTLLRSILKDDLIQVLETELKKVGQ